MCHLYLCVCLCVWLQITQPNIINPKARFFPDESSLYQQQLQHAPVGWSRISQPYPPKPDTISAQHSLDELSTGAKNLNGSSKSSSFDQQDSGIDLIDQLASNGSSQRSSPKAAASGKTSTGSEINTKATGTSESNHGLSRSALNGQTDNSISNDSSIVSVVVAADTSTDTKRPMGTVIFENRHRKAENAVLDNFGNKIVAGKCKVSLR